MRFPYRPSCSYLHVDENDIPYLHYAYFFLTEFYLSPLGGWSFHVAGIREAKCCSCHASKGHPGAKVPSQPGGDHRLPLLQHLSHHPVHGLRI